MKRKIKFKVKNFDEWKRFITKTMPFIPPDVDMLFMGWKQHLIGGFSVRVFIGERGVNGICMKDVYTYRMWLSNIEDDGYMVILEKV